MSPYEDLDAAPCKIGDKMLSGMEWVPAYPDNTCGRHRILLIAIPEHFI
jgi:hypothetical protein